MTTRPRYFNESQIENASLEMEEKAEQIESFREKVGLVGSVDLIFVHEGIFHLYELCADWFNEFQHLTESQFDEDEELEIDDNAVAEWADKLANHPRFRTCKTAAQRSYLLEEIAGEENDNAPHALILEAAEKVYFVKIKPKEDERLKREASRLRKEGLNLNVIAQKLGISRDRVSGLLAD